MHRNIALLLLLSSAFVGAAYIFTKNGLTLFAPMQLLGFRFTLGLLFFLLMAALGIIKLKKPSSFHPLILLQVLLTPILYFSFEIFGLQRIDSSLAAIILSSSPIFASMVSARLLKESFSLKQLLFTLLAFSGICILNIAGGMGSPGEMVGFILIILATACSSLSGSVTKILMRDYSSFTLLFFSYLCGAVFFTGAGIIDAAAAGKLDSYFKPLTDPLGIVTILYLSTMPGIVCSLIQYYCLQRAKVSVVSVFSYLTPVVSLILASVFLHENISLLDIGCMILIIGAMAGSVFFGSRSKRQEVNYSSADNEKICERSV